jgi:predicted NBD/HSP70 family sugar kinase
LRARIPNRKAKEIYSQLRTQGTLSKQELLEQSGLSVSTATRVLDELMEAGLIQEVGLGESTGGRRPILYRIAPAYGYVFGLDISRIHSNLVLYDMNLNKIDSFRWLMTDRMTPDHFIDQVVQAAKGMTNAQQISLESVLGMGIGAVGPVSFESGVIVNPLHFPASGWSNVLICESLEERLKIPVLLDNGANTAILGEYWADVPHEHQHLLYIHAGVGLRSAIMSNGKVVYGAVDMEGAVGQMIIQTDGLPYQEPGRSFGRLESYFSIHALEQTAQSQLKKGRKSILNERVGDPEDINFFHLLEALHANDPLVTEIFSQSAAYFGIGLANLLNILHPEKVILGGPLIATNDLVFDIATELALKNTYYYPDYKVTFSKGKLGDDAVALGAAGTVIAHMTDR